VQFSGISLETLMKTKEMSIGIFGGTIKDE
jgi:hypothetical protein